MWLLFAASNAFFESLSDAYSKSLTKKLDIVLASFLIRILAFGLFLVSWWILDGTYVLSDKFWYSAAGSIALNTVATILYMRALRDTDLSLCLPLLKFSPVWTLLTAPLINGDFVGPIGIVGILVMVVGSYAANFSLNAVGRWEPLKVMWSNRGMRSMLLVSILWSIAGPLDREAIRSSSPWFFLLVLNGGLTFTLLGLTLTYSSQSSMPSLKTIWATLPRAIFSYLSTAAQMHAFALAPVPVVISIKRSSVLFGMIWGKLFFGEKNVRERFVGALITLVGMVLVVYSTK